MSRVRCGDCGSVAGVRLVSPRRSACARCRAALGLVPYDTPEQLAMIRARVTGETVAQALAALQGEPSTDSPTPPRPDPDRPSVPPGRLHSL